MFNRLFLGFGLLVFVWCSSNSLAENDHKHNHNNDSETEIVIDSVDHTSSMDEDNHESHDHADYDSDVNHDNNNADKHGHDDHKDEFSFQLTPDAVKLAGIVISRTHEGHISKTVELPGEVGFNEDRVAHIAPRFAGIAQDAKYRVGDFVDKGQVVAIIESNESMTTYTISAPISGWIIERHITPGEYVSEENSIYVIVDLSTVWVNLAVYPKDAERVRKGQIVEIKVIGSENITSGVIEYITPIVDFRTRNLTARITLPNPENRWRPGSFVQGTITTESSKKGLVVEKSAIQYLDEKSVVFVVDGPNKFRPVEVLTGDENQKLVQILNGLDYGTEYVSEGAFELKAKIVTSNLDAHAGHGH